MSRLFAVAVLLLALLCAACGTDQPPPAVPAVSAPGPFPQTSGTLRLDGLSAPVRVVRDRWGIPHIYASSQDDLFLAQGFVQAQDRLFQIDLWRRSTLGRIAEILGPDFIARDRMTRLMAYRGPLEVEWTSYSPDTQRIAEQFVRGVNQWIEIARRDPPEEFRVAGYLPEPWQATDLLSRGEAFTMSGNALAEVFRARIMTAVGADIAERLLPPDPPVAVRVAPDIDLSLLNYQLSEGLRRIAAPPAFGPMTTVARASPTLETTDEGSNNWVVSGVRSATGHPLLANDPHRALDHPSLRYLVHLKAPGWNVIGAVVPWFPGVAIGHNERVAWGLTIFANDAQDLYVERVNPANARQYQWRGQWVDMQAVIDTIQVKGRDKPVTVEHFYTRHGPVVAVDTERHLAFALRWTGAEPGTAGYLGALALDRATDGNTFRRALSRWKMPGENFVYADVDGAIGYQAASLAPIRPNWTGLLPVPGWTGEYEWSGWYDLDELPHDANPRSGYLATANHNTLPEGYRPRVGFEWSDPARISRIRAVLDTPGTFSVDDFKRLQHDTRAWKADRIVPLLEKLTFEAPATERARRMLIDWDRHVRRGSPGALLYAFWERQLSRRLLAPHLDRHLSEEFLARGNAVLVRALTGPPAAWFDRDGSRSRDALLEEALTAALEEIEKTVGPDQANWDWARLHTATFRHPLSTTSALAARFNVGPIGRDGYGTTVFMTFGSALTQTNGATFRQIVDLADWDRSVGTSAPGQSGQPGSPHFADLAALWGEQTYFPFAFSDEAVTRAAESTVLLTPEP